MTLRLNVSRKNKIRIAVAVVCAGFTTWLFLPRHSKDINGTLSVTFVGVSPKDSKVLQFIITNSFKHPVEFEMEHVPVDFAYRVRSHEGEILSQSTIIFEMPSVFAKPFTSSYATNRWSLGLAYWDSSIQPRPGDSSPLLAHRIRITLADVLYTLGLDTVGNWLHPEYEYEHADFPEMFGDRLAKPDDRKYPARR